MTTGATHAAPAGITEVYFDFLCPYAWRGLELAQVLRAGGHAFRLRHFSLVQGNHPDNAGQAEPIWWLTDQPLGGDAAEPRLQAQNASLAAFLGAQAAARQGEEAAWNFSLALFRLRHEEKQTLDEAALGQAAQAAGLDLGQFEADRQDEAALRARLREDLAAAAELGVFGTPTFVLPGGQAAYYRFENLTRDPAEAGQFWSLYTAVLTSEAGIGTIKRAKNRPPSRR